MKILVKILEIWYTSLVTIYGSERDHGRKEILQNEKRYPSKFLSGSTKYSSETVEFEGETYPLIRVEISSDSHPFYTGRQKFTQADGRVDRFNKKYGLK